MSKKKKVVITPEIIGRVSNLPAYCSGVQSDAGLVESGIQIFFILRIIILALVDKKIKFNEIISIWKAITKELKVNHAFRFWGDDLTIDALPQGIRKGSLLKKIENGTKIKLYYNTKIRLENIAIAKAYSFGTIGRLYDYPTFIEFVLDLIRTIKPNIPTLNDSPYLEHCAQNTTVVEDLLLTGIPGEVSNKFIPNITNRSKVHPQDLINWVESPAGKKAGYVLADKFNC